MMARAPKEVWDRSEGDKAVLLAAIWKETDCALWTPGDTWIEKGQKCKQVVGVVDKCIIFETKRWTEGAYIALFH